VPVSIGAAAPVQVPDGIRLVLNLPPGPGLAGKLTLDWVRPSFGGDKP
jgi:general secretion pathway protein J